MKVEIRFFASLKERVGLSGLSLELDAGADFESLVCAIASHCGAEVAAAIAAPNIRVARNQSIEDPPFDLADGDEIAFLPPVTGG